MDNFSINKLSKDDIDKAYRFIYVFEKEIKSRYGEFDFNSVDIDKFCHEYKIKKKERRTTKLTENYFWFDTKKAKGVQNNDFAHNLLRHIRNAMAHGNFKKVIVRKAYYIFEDYNKNKELTMYGKISADLFWKFLNIVLRTNPLMNKNITFK